MVHCFGGPPPLPRDSGCMGGGWGCVEVEGRNKSWGKEEVCAITMKGLAHPFREEEYYL